MACLRRANDIIDLKKCTDGVKKALEDEEYEQVNKYSVGFILKVKFPLFLGSCSYSSIFKY